MQEELDRQDNSWEPAVHGQTHPKDADQYSRPRLPGRDPRLPRGHPPAPAQHSLRQVVYEHILTTGYSDDEILRLDAGEFLFVRGFNWLDNPTSIDFVPWNKSETSTASAA